MRNESSISATRGWDGEWLCDLAAVFGSVSGESGSCGLRNAKDSTPEEQGLVVL